MDYTSIPNYIIISVFEDTISPKDLKKFKKIITWLGFKDFEFYIKALKHDFQRSLQGIERLKNQSRIDKIILIESQYINKTYNFYLLFRFWYAKRMYFKLNSNFVKEFFEFKSIMDVNDKRVLQLFALSNLKRIAINSNDKSDYDLYHRTFDSYNSQLEFENAHIKLLNSNTIGSERHIFNNSLNDFQIGMIGEMLAKAEKPLISDEMIISLQLIFKYSPSNSDKILHYPIIWNGTGVELFFFFVIMNDLNIVRCDISKLHEILPKSFVKEDCTKFKSESLKKVYKRYFYLQENHSYRHRIPKNLTTVLKKMKDLSGNRTILS